MRVAASITAATFGFAVLTGATEAAMHGFKFFVFRQAGTGETGKPDTQTDQQFLAQQAAAHHVAPKGRHVAKSHL
jgi:hypothetical protein